jgi:hypothetical protein
MSRKYKFLNKEGLYFVSFAPVNWIDVFTRRCTKGSTAKIPTDDKQTTGV